MRQAKRRRFVGRVGEVLRVPFGVFVSRMVKQACRPWLT